MSGPNVIFIMADDMGYGDISCVNNGLSDTPNLDALYSQSLRVSQGYAASCVCAPSRAGFLTGRYPQRTGCICLNDFHGLNRLAARERTIADIFSNGGYQTGIIGKWHCGEARGSRPEDRGFAEVEAYHPQGQDYWKWQIDTNGTQVYDQGRYLTEYLSECAVSFIRRNHSKPFFLHLAYYAPHRPLQAPQNLVDKYFERGNLTKGQATVYAMIEVMDRGIGMINEELEKQGLLENTIVIFTSDNGPDDYAVGDMLPERFNCGLRGNKYSVHDGGIRVPFLVRWPDKLKAGSECHDLFHFVDILPTLAAACSLDLPEDLELDGGNLLETWFGHNSGDYGKRYWQWNRYYPQAGCNAAMRDGDWKLVIPGRDGYREMIAADVAMLQGTLPKNLTPAPLPDLGAIHDPLLFNMADDPLERNDLSIAYAHVARRMQSELEQWQRNVCDDLDLVLKSQFK